MRKQGLLVLFNTALAIGLSQGITNAQSINDDVVRVNTRVVSVDVLVQDKKTRDPVTDLSLDAFRVFDNGQERKLTYFGRDGLRRQPLALVLTFELNTSAILYLAKPEVMEGIISSLDKLQPSDEVAVLQTWYEPGAKPGATGSFSFELRSKIVEPLTRDRTKTATALRSVQQFAEQNLRRVKLLFSFSELYKGTWKQEIWAGVKGAVGAPIEPPLKMSVAPDFEYIIDKAPTLARDHPDSLLAIVSTTDDLGAELSRDSTEKAEKLIAAGVMVNGLVVKKNLEARGVDMTGRILSPVLGARFHTISYYSEQTGGQVTTVTKPAEFAAAIGRVVGGLASRYSVGFSLNEAERDDGKMHGLVVKVSAPAAKGGTHPLLISARRGYYPPPLPKKTAP